VQHSGGSTILEGGGDFLYFFLFNNFENSREIFEKFMRILNNFLKIS
jgi:hypothetical protein